MPMKFNWQLWDNFVAAAEELNLPLESISGRCVKIVLPPEVADRFYAQIDTPLARMIHVYTTLTKQGEYGGWGRALKELREAEEYMHDFWLQFGGRGMNSGDQYWFPNLQWHKSDNATKEEIVDALKVMLDDANYERNLQHALLLQELDSEDETD